MRVAIAGSRSVVGGIATAVLHEHGHEVVDLGSSVDDLLDTDVLTARLRDCDAVLSLTRQLPVGIAARFRRSSRTHDLLSSEGVDRLVAAARAAGVRRVVRQSTSLMYADEGEDWITERSPVCITPATEPLSVGEAVVESYTSTCRAGVVLRLGSVVGNSGLTRFVLRAAAQNRPVGVGSPDGFVHLVHSDDVGPALLAALEAPSGVYNVGAQPVRRHELVDGCARAAGRERGVFLGPRWTRFAGSRTEPLTRSLRVDSSAFSSVTGWLPRRAEFDLGWFEAARVPQVLA